MTAPPVASVYIPCHNYARFVREAVNSVLRQTVDVWELLIVDDGSTDESWDVITKFEGTPGVRITRNAEPQGLRVVVNQAIQEAAGEFVLRLDADDILHPRALELLMLEASRQPHLGVIFPDYYYIDERGRVTGVECIPTVNDQYEAVTFPPHAAGALVRKSLLEQIGPFEPDLRSQDGHEFWLKLLRTNASVLHVPLPLFSYRQHGDSLSSSLEKVLRDRAEIKRRLATQHPDSRPVVAILPVKNTYPDLPDVPFTRFRGTTLLDHALTEISSVPDIGSVIVTTDCPRVAAYTSKGWPNVISRVRPVELRTPETTIDEILLALVSEEGLSEETLLCLLSLHTPLRKAGHIQKALDTFQLYGVDSVISVYEEKSSMYQMGALGLQPLNPGREQRLRREREAVYIDSGAIRVIPVGNLRKPSMLGERIGHSLMRAEESFQIKSRHDLDTLLGWEEDN